jgi:hypothetical protein
MLMTVLAASLGALAAVPLAVLMAAALYLGAAGVGVRTLGRVLLGPWVRLPA